MDSQTVIALAGIASGAIVTPIITALLTRRMLGEQQLAERESADLLDARRFIMDVAAGTVEFQDASRHYGRELEQAAKGDGSITEELLAARRNLSSKAYYIDTGGGTFWHMVGYESSVAVSHRAVIENAEAMVEIAERIESARSVSPDDLKEWRSAAVASSLDFRRFAAAIGGRVGFRLPGALIG